MKTTKQGVKYKIKKYLIIILIVVFILFQISYWNNQSIELTILQLTFFSVFIFVVGYNFGKNKAEDDAYFKYECLKDRYEELKEEYKYFKNEESKNK